MDLTVQLHQETDLGLLVGDFSDLKHLVKMLNGAWESVEFRFEKMKAKPNYYLFIEDDKSLDNAEVGVVERHGDKVYAFTPAVHDLIMGAYKRYVTEFGDPTL
ncbi:MAG: hypothetical protein ACI9QC_000871 [Oceanicoccus sp.]|jgi:hypothetical protein